MDIIKCPSCDKKNLDDQSHCEHCGEPIQQSVSPLSDVVDDDETNEQIEQSPEVQESVSDTKECPLCAETIKAAAIKCRFCGSLLDGTTQVAGQALKEVSEVIPTNDFMRESVSGTISSGPQDDGIIATPSRYRKMKWIAISTVTLFLVAGVFVCNHQRLPNRWERSCNEYNREIKRCSLPSSLECDSSNTDQYSTECIELKISMVGCLDEAIGENCRISKIERCKRLVASVDSRCKVSGGTGTLSLSDIQVGMRVSVEWNGRWYPAQVLGTTSDGRVNIHFVGFGSRWDGPVPLSRIRTNAREKLSRSTGRTVTSVSELSVGMSILAEWNGRWYRAQVIDIVSDHQVSIHYVSFGSNWDGPIPLSRIRIPQ